MQAPDELAPRLHFPAWLINFAGGLLAILGLVGLLGPPYLNASIASSEPVQRLERKQDKAEAEFEQYRKDQAQLRTELEVIKAIVLRIEGRLDKPAK